MLKRKFAHFNLHFFTGLLFGFFALCFFLELNKSANKSVSFLTYMQARESQRHFHTVPEKKTAAPTPAHSIRILCWIMTGPKYLKSRTTHIKNTWAKHCNIVLYMSSEKTDFPTVGLNVSEGRENLYWKTIRAFQYIYEQHMDDADWFVKADDDTYMIVENLRYALSNYDTETPVYLGRRFYPFLKNGYMAGGAGYVLSKEALRRFIKGFSTGSCTHFSEIEDMALGQCMQTMEVEPTDSRDIKGRQRFHAYPPEYHVVRQSPRPTPWYLVYEFYPVVEGPTSSSDLAISFHYISPDMLYVLDYLAYRLRPYGYKYRFNPDEAT